MRPLDSTASAGWDQLDIARLLTLEPIGPGRWRSVHGDANMNGRSYGGQLLGQAMTAALADSPVDRIPTTMQFMFLQGAMPEEAIEYQVTNLQRGKRFTSRHVRGSQGSGRIVLDAQVTCAMPLDAPEHQSPSPAPPGERPEDGDRLDDVDPALVSEITRLGGYSQDRKRSVEFRIPDAGRQLTPATMTDRFRFWMRATQALPDDARVQAAAFAYLSDWWLNFSSLGMHLRGIGARKLYISSLNHAIWMHRPVRADAWLHVQTVSPVSANGRGLSIGSVHDEQGRVVASLAQECLMAYAD
jgi:acyl-CoA thioesterase II